METYFVALLVFIAILFCIGFFGLVFRSKQEGTSIPLLQQQILELQKQVRDSLSEGNKRMDERLESISKLMADSNKTLGERLQGATRVVGDVQKGLGELSKATDQMIDVGKDISKLQDILQAPKLRGMMGEMFLEELLSQVLPKKYFQMGYSFRSGEKVDAIVYIGKMLVPVDSKFPLENFRRLIESQTEEERKINRKSFARDVKKHVDAIAQKYILPDEGTSDFAFMYIPAENVYYEVIVSGDNSEENICDYAVGKRVIPVSPNTFLAYLQVIVMGLKGLSIEKNAKKVMNYLGRLQGDLTRFRDDFEVVGRHISNAKNKYEESERKLERLGDKLLNVGKTSDEIEND
ncbi:DNA recombination protein RmuC [Candidatus Oleimmundimicrobium sp.]|uniref:DNA recombination protein RmuC n=1 Tax=Candidatus Oleimmundimicrobium sp. TaxID=3060597 RepID=UPI00271E3FB8|nr:DNA recombination protein RmuC [Candidatus Oleimmundimicrobium sp.]MDO8885999.1 DNA recombination protein RmuC [Candidatus Oleimmundimicrobium sp.]